MLTRGLFFALTDAELKQLRHAKGDPTRRALVALWEEEWQTEWLCETDKAWRYIQYTIGKNYLLSRNPPLAIDLFFGKSLHRAHFYIIGLHEHGKMQSLIEEINQIDETRFHQLFNDRITQARWMRVFGEPLDTTRVTYVWHWLAKIQEFFNRCFVARRHIIFTAYSQ